MQRPLFGQHSLYIRIGHFLIIILEAAGSLQFAVNILVVFVSRVKATFDGTCKPSWCNQNTRYTAGYVHISIWPQTPQVILALVVLQAITII